MGTNTNMGVNNAYRVSPEQWTMVTLTNQGNPESQRPTSMATIQSATVNDTVWVERINIYPVERKRKQQLFIACKTSAPPTSAHRQRRPRSRYSAVSSESGAVVITTDTLVPFNAGVALTIQPTHTVPSAPTRRLGPHPDCPVTEHPITPEPSPEMQANTRQHGTEHAVNLMATNGYENHQGHDIQGLSTSQLHLRQWSHRPGYVRHLKGFFTDEWVRIRKAHFFVDTADRGDSNASAWAQHYVWKIKALEPLVGCSAD